MTLEHFKLPRDDWYDITNWNYVDKEVYDPSKFTVIGSPIITDNGVVSKFNSSNYIKILNVPELGKITESLRFTSSFVYNNFSAEQTIWNKNLNLDLRLMNGSIMLRTYDDSKSNTFSILQSQHKVANGEQVFCDVVITPNLCRIKINDVEYTKEQVTDFSYLANAVDRTIIIGMSNAFNLYFRTSIDLKAFSITVDGEEVFNGTKTVQEKIPPKGEIVGRLYKEALIENFNAIENKLNELSGLTAYETQVPDFSNYNYEDVTLDSPNNKVVNLQSFLKIMNLIGVPIECRFTGKLCNKVTYYDKNMRYHTIVNQKLDDLGTDGKVYIVLDSSNDTVSAVSDITDLTNKFLLGVYDNGRVYNLRSTGLVDINVLTHLCDMSVEPFFIGSLNGTKKTEGIYRNGRIIGAWGRESKGAYPKDITLFDIGRQ